MCTNTQYLKENEITETNTIIYGTIQSGIFNIKGVYGKYLTKYTGPIRGTPGVREVCVDVESEVPDRNVCLL
jgi:hypothetical protein